MFIKKLLDDSNNEHYQVFDSNHNRIYLEEFNGYWAKFKYDNNNNMIYYENSLLYWAKFKYDKNGNRTHYINSLGYWENNN